MILYEWTGQDGRRYRMAAGRDAIRPMQPGQSYELQINDGLSWWPMVDWNAARAALSLMPEDSTNG